MLSAHLVTVNVVAVQQCTISLESKVFLYIREQLTSAYTLKQICVQLVFRSSTNTVLLKE